MQKSVDFITNKQITMQKWSQQYGKNIKTNRANIWANKIDIKTEINNPKIRRISSIEVADSDINDITYAVNKTKTINIKARYIPTMLTHFPKHRVEIIEYAYARWEIGYTEYLIIRIAFLVDIGREIIAEKSFRRGVREIAESLWTVIEIAEIIREENIWLLTRSKWPQPQNRRI